MFGGRTSSSVTKGVTKFREILNYVDKDYVDTVNTDDLVDYSIEKMLEKLDPHTTYIPSKDLEMARTQLESDFDGIGIEFNIFKDTVYVIAPFNGGPAETAGLRAGDKIVSVNGQPMVGTDIENSSVFGKLRGPRGTKVRVGVLRKASKDPLEFTITRNRIPQYSIDAAYMVDNTTGYIKVNRFASNTYDEFKKSLSQLKRQGMQQLVLDLRGNPGRLHGPRHQHGRRVPLGRQADRVHRRQRGPLRPENQSFPARHLSKKAPSWCSSTKAAPRPPKSWPAPFRTTTGPSSWAAAPSARASCRPPSPSTTAPNCA
jgi:hypothetical protein